VDSNSARNVKAARDWRMNLDTAVQERRGCRDSEEQDGQSTGGNSLENNEETERVKR
jgi:hypothetical protein